MKSKRFWIVVVLSLALGVLLAYEQSNWRQSRLAALPVERGKREPLIVEFQLAVASADTVTESIRDRYERSISEDEKAIEILATSVSDYGSDNRSCRKHFNHFWWCSCLLYGK